MRFWALALLPVVLVIFVLPLDSQEQKQQQEIPPEQLPTVNAEVSVSIVNLYATVRSEKGRPIYSLTQDDFTLYINGKKQEISHFSNDVTEPLNIVFLLDVSGSMRLLDKFETAKNIIKAIMAKLTPDDEVALMIFADGAVEMLVDFTKDKPSLIRRMDQLKPYGGTALRDAIAYSHRLLMEQIGKKGVLLLSDGLDNRSDLPLEQAVQMAANVEVPIYTFELIRSKWIDEAQKEQDIDVLPLKVFAEATGGLYFTLEEASVEDIDKACSKIFEDLKYQYYIGYTPEGTVSYGKVTLKTKDPKHRVRVRYSVVSGG
jgi:Ca-activated chloride channel family protein